MRRLALLAGAAVALVAWALHRERMIALRAVQLDAERRAWDQARRELIEGYAAVRPLWREYAAGG